MNRIPIFILIIVILSACKPSDLKGDEESLLIYTSIYPLEYIVTEIAADKAIAESIYPPGVDAHTYEPTSREITQLANGDAFIYIGADMEGFAETMADALQNQAIQFLEIGTHHELFSSAIATDDHHSNFDPHIWLDPIRMIQMAEIITNELTDLQPEHKELFLENLSNFTEKMTVLDEQFAATLTNKDNKEILVSHAAYGYWELRYGIEQIAISGLSSSDEPSQKELASVATLAQDKNIEYVIFDQTGTNRIATILQEYIGADPLYIHNLEVLTEEDINNSEDYYSIMEKNMQALDKATN